MVDKERMRPGSLVCIPLSALTLLAGWQERHLIYNKTVPLVPDYPVPEEVEEEKREVYLDDVHENW